jgi:hypothetical protein
MNDEERRIITGFVERISGVQQQGGGYGASPWGGSVPSTQPSQRPPLPPVDPEADRLITDLFNRYPEARYRITQTAFVQEAALLQAQNRIQELEWELENARRQGQYAQAQAAQQNRGGGGFLGGMFGGGGGARQAVAPPPPMPPRPQPLAPAPGMATPQMLQQAAGPGRSSLGFLGTALMTAAGVAGGLVLGNALMGMMSGAGAHAAALGGLGGQGAGDAGAGGFGQEQVPAEAASPWTDPGQAAGGWGGEKTPYQEAADAQPAGYDDAGYGSAQDDASYGGYDDGGGGEEEI